MACVLISTFLRGGQVLEPLSSNNSDPSNTATLLNPTVGPPQTLNGVLDRSKRLVSSASKIEGQSNLVHVLLPKLHVLLSLEGQELRAR